MSENIENEERVMITKDKYERIYLDYVNLSNTTKLCLINHYFDDDNHTLIKNGHTLRIRNINELDYELTLKIKGDNGDKEINIPLNNKEYKELINKLDLSKYRSILDKVNLLNHGDIILLTSLKTERLEVSYDSYLLVIDKNYYSDIIDYDIEVESSSKKLAKQYIDEICKKYSLTYKEHYIGKSHRAINAIKD